MKFWSKLLRDYFAAKAMAAMLTTELPHEVPEWAKGLTVRAYLARRAYLMADAMLEARK